ncbi:MAG TPA: OB-fold nucleic acid binding domain-containing protein [Mycobacteriales bacterium]|nr:OB-fold nucleic acid binding domain-containing protein [Mycobacteriales bacterium]
MSTATPGAPGRFRRALARLALDDDQLADRELQGRCAEAGATFVNECTRGEPVRVAGTLRAVTLRPRAGAPTLEAELYDGTGCVTLIWLGRRRIAGIECGRRVVAHGRLTEHDGRATIYNAAYELQPVD